MSDVIDGTNKRSSGNQPPLPPRVSFAAGETVPGLASWVLERKLGGGGFGEVWLATHALGKEKPRAVKFCTDPEAKRRLVTHEKNVVARVMKYAGDHPNIVPLLEYNPDGDVPWLMYEFVEGGTLADATNARDWRELPFPKRLGRAVRVLHAVASALAACHRLTPPLVHRDLKPQNVLMAGLVPRLTDFGIGSVVARPRDDPSTAELTAYAAQLPTGLQYHRSYLWAAPEREFGSPPDPLDDVYALGVLAYQLIVGDLRFGPGPDAMLKLRELDVPGEFVALVINSVAIDPLRRPKDATEWESVLAALLQKMHGRAGSTDTSTRGSQPVLLTEPTAELPARTGPSPLLPPPVGRGPNPLPLEVPLSEPVHQPARGGRELRTRRKRKVLATVLVGALALGLVVAVVVAAFPPGKRGEPGLPTGRGESPESDVSGTKNRGANGGPPEPKNEPKVAKPTKPGERRDIEIAPGVQMTFCWIPGSVGECQLGSPEEEQDYIAKAFYDGKRPDWLDAEAERRRGKFKTGGFWMGKYEVTQGEWQAVMGDNPSYFDGTKDNKAKGMNTSRFPVEGASWDRICGRGKYLGAGFLDKIDHGSIRRALGKSGQFRLPTEDEWEYACRGGRGNKRPFYWGNTLNGTEANCDSHFPYVPNGTGQYLERPCAVDFTNGEKYEPHPWGLIHMHGNVWEWCADHADALGPARLLRGGSWRDGAPYCRAATRVTVAPEQEDINIGFRLIVPVLP